MRKRKALGKGLSALIPDANGLGAEEGEFFQCPIADIERNPLQPRQEFGGPEFEGLVKSVKEKGILTPLLVTKTAEGYRLIAGERRWRAAQKARLERVPVVVRETTPLESLELALVENIHRKDLNPIEEAHAYKRWLGDTKKTQEALAKRLGKERSTVTNMLRLLNLPKVIQEDIIQERLSMGHARVLAGVKGSAEQKRIRDLIIQKALSVRQLEELVKIKKKAPQRKKPIQDEDAYYFKTLADNLKRSLGTKVDIRRRGKQGSIVIYFYSDEELDRLLDLLS
ncbi:MAG: chromosome partitioning protein ParB [Nitrospira bacterium SG8_3]|nr:MAG: chromosome partitioning protein ParB [Nitrospira bacterium SG8_3]